MFRHEALRNPQSQPGSLLPLGGEEGLEKLVADFLGDAVAVVARPIANTPKVISTIHDSIRLARLVLRTLNAR